MTVRSRKDSGITVTDQFCGGGGSTIGAKRAGLIVLEAQNHWKRAVETYSANHQNTRVHHADVSNTDPRKLATTDMLITSPECTTHSPAGGNRLRVIPQRDMFAPDIDDPKFERSRATMQDVIRYAEYHRYECIVVENVVEVTRWPLFSWWLDGMRMLGYEFRIVSLNSMFCWPTPQSRDRIYIVFWRKGNRAPNLEITPPAYCNACDATVAAVQTWKPAALARAGATHGQPIGKYKFQYTYNCPRCSLIVTPYYYAAMNAIDFTVSGERIGDRLRALKPRTRARIAHGIAKYANRPLLIRTMDGHRFDCRVRDAASSPMDAQPASSITGLATPFIVKLKGTDPSHVTSSAQPVDGELPTLTASGKTAALVTPGAVALLVNTRNGSGLGYRVRNALDDTIATQTAGLDHAIATSPGFVFPAGSNPGPPKHVAAEELPALTCTDRLAVVLGPTFVTSNRTNNVPRAMDDVLPGITTSTGGGSYLVSGSAIISLRDADAMHVGPLSEELRTLTTQQQTAMIGVDHAPFVLNYRSDPTRLDDPLHTQRTHGLDALVEAPSIDVDDCYFRMLMAREIGLGMAFPADYIVTGNSTEQVKQFGNAVTPPSMDLLTSRCAASLAPELAA